MLIFQLAKFSWPLHFCSSGKENSNSIAFMLDNLFELQESLVIAKTFID